jgi:xanthine dehydrogenase YagR molybdenum-binding subunit
VRVEGPDKVSGRAVYAYEHRIDRVAYGRAVGATVARGRVIDVDVESALADPAVLAVLWFGNAPRLATDEPSELSILQTDRVAYRGQIVALVVAESLETATEAAERLDIRYAEEPFAVELRVDDPELYAPEKVNPGFPTDTNEGDVEAALARAACSVDAVYRTPAYHNNPMEPHAAIAVWNRDALTVYDSNQGVFPVRDKLAEIFGIPPGDVHVISEHVGGAFGSKGTPRPIVVGAAMAARAVGRPVKLAATRAQMFVFVGYRTPTIQRVRLGTDDDAQLVALAHDVVEQTSTLQEFAEQTAVPSRMMYASPHRRTTHRLRRLDVPTPSWMRAPGECPGMYALESAMDELAVACAIDPIELRVRNEPRVDPETGKPFPSRHLVECLREGAQRIGWSARAEPGARRVGRGLVGLGVAASTYPARTRPSSARARALPDGGFEIEIAAADIGTGARTVLGQIAADALGVDAARVRVRLGDSALPQAPLAGGSMGTSSWGFAVTRACERLLESMHGPGEPAEVSVDTTAELDAREERPSHAFGAQFAEVRVDVDTGEVRVSRLVGVFAVGRVMNALTARSQLIGGMTMGLSMALLEESVLDAQFGDYLNHDLAQYEIASCADVESVDVSWIDEEDDYVNPMGAKGIGEIGIVGTAAAIANATFNATGVRVRDLPIRLDAMVGSVAPSAPEREDGR